MVKPGNGLLGAIACRRQGILVPVWKEERLWHHRRDRTASAGREFNEITAVGACRIVTARVAGTRPPNAFRGR